MFNHSKAQFQSTQHLSKHYKFIFHLIFDHFFHTLSSKGIMTLFNLQSGIKRHSSTTKVASNLYYNLFRYTKYPMKNRYFDSRLLLNFMLSAAQEVTGCSFNPEWILGEGQGIRTNRGQGYSYWLIYLKPPLNLNKQGARK